MSLIRSALFQDPWLPLELSDMERTFRQVQRDMNRTVNSFFNAPSSSEESSSFSSPMYIPRIDYHETDQEYTILADLPGMPKENLHLEALDNKLILSGEMKNHWEDSKEENEKKGGKRVHVCERRWGKFQRTLPLPSNADTNQIKGVMENGVLSITIPKLPSTKGASRFVPIS
ncbi:hypothetical protein HMI55_004439 [Coelomomyces lativittatus]|nr:hypothetical protein HMI56_004353 [Coelomomyces lativittatus]KAJ1514709.1 hypothetical protein HMI55_004439 [Coelomomyces lativittatus]